MYRRIPLGLLLSLLVLASAAYSADGITISEALQYSVLPKDLPLSEVQVFTESRVPPMPDVKSVREWEQHASRMRRDTLNRIVFRGEAAKWRDAKLRVAWVDTIDGGPGYRIKKLRYEAVPGMWIPALLYEPTDLRGRVPVVLNVNGHDRRNGKAAEYKQIRCINLAKRGMLALNVEWLGMGQLNTDGFNHYRMNQLDLCGTSGLAPFYLAMSRAIDFLLTLEHADPNRVAVAGLSGGGWQTIVISSLDERVTLSDPVAGYSSFRTRAHNFSDLGDSEQTPNDLATVADYAHLTAMRAPRPTLLSFNANDGCCFKAGHALPPLLDAARPIYRLYGSLDHLRAHVNFDPGSHNFEQDNREALYRMIGEFFFADDQSYDTNEMESTDELKPKWDLHIEVPPDNADFHSLAVDLSRDLPRQPSEQSDTDASRDMRRRALEDVVHVHDYKVTQVKTESLLLTTGAAAAHRLTIGTDWTVPAIELTPEISSTETVILVSDDGRVAVGDMAEKLLGSGATVLAVDPFYLGESAISQRNFLFALLVAAVGERPLGLQVSQLRAVARWARTRTAAPVRVVAVGPRSSLFSLIAAALSPDSIDQVDLYDALRSLKEVITRDLSVNQSPELFCFGLLEQFDIPPIAELVAPREVRFPDRGR